jgi:toxin ParE1/3/4
VIVRFSAEAERELEAIGDWIAADSPARALSFVREPRDACIGLAEFPNRFSLVPRYERHCLRHPVQAATPSSTGSGAGR